MWVKGVSGASVNTNSLYFTVWLSKYMPNKVCGEISYPQPNFNGSIGNGEVISSNTLYNGWYHLSMLGLECVHVSKRIPSTNTENMRLEHKVHCM